MIFAGGHRLLPREMAGDADHIEDVEQILVPIHVFEMDRRRAGRTDSPRRSVGVVDRVRAAWTVSAGFQVVIDHGADGLRRNRIGDQRSITSGGGRHAGRAG